jgi:small subunit ribosomal protein S6
MNFYELNYLISAELSIEEIKNLQEKINSFLREEGGEIEKSGLPIKKKLAYPIKKKNEAYFGNLDFYLSPEKLENFEKKIKKEEKILRYLILKKKVEKKVEIPKPKIKKEKKVELKEIEKKLEEILGK